MIDATSLDAVAAAEARAAAAKARLTRTINEIGHRLSPSTIAQEAATTAKVKARRLADDATDVALDNPVATGTGAAVVTGFLGWRLWRRIRRPATTSPGERSQAQQQHRGDNGGQQDIQPRRDGQQRDGQQPVTD